jgi:hypothetical protein
MALSHSKTSSSYELNFNLDNLMQLLRSIVHYSDFTATTSCSAPVSCIGTLILAVSATWISPLTSRRLVPAVPYRSPNQTHAIYTPDTTYTITRLSVDLSQGIETPLVSMSISGLRRVNNGSGIFVFLIHTC